MNSELSPAFALPEGVEIFEVSDILDFVPDIEVVVVDPAEDVLGVEVVDVENEEVVLAEIGGSDGGLGDDGLTDFGHGHDFFIIPGPLEGDGYEDPRPSTSAGFAMEAQPTASSITDLSHQAVPSWQNSDLFIGSFPGLADDNLADDLLEAASQDEQRALLEQKLANPLLKQSGRRTKRKDRPASAKVTDIGEMVEMANAFQQVYEAGKGKASNEKHKRDRWRLAVDSLRQILPNVDDSTVETDVIAETARCVTHLREQATGDMMAKFYAEYASF